MANQFTSEILKICVGQICQSIGYQGSYSTPVEVLTDLLHRYLAELCRLTHRYTEHFGRSEPTLDDLGLAFMDMGISVAELEEYFANVDCPPFPHPLPSLPVPRPSNLNFLKPGSREILSRPIHVHEHLPPMYPEKEEEEVDVKVSVGVDEGVTEGASPTISPQPALKRPAESEVSPAKKQKFSLEDEGQPVREIVSVMMTTSGFISSAREGKLPEARCPDIPMALPRSTSPSNIGKKKMTVEKLIKQKNNQMGSGAARSGGPPRPPRPNKIKAGKDRVIGKGLKIPKLPSRPLSLPKGGPPGSSPLPPKLKMPLLKPPTPKPPKVSSPKPSVPPKAASTPKTSPPKSSQSPRPQTPKSSSPKIKVPKPPRPPKVDGKKGGTGQAKPREGDKEGEGASGGSKKIKKEKDGSSSSSSSSSKKEGKKEGKKEKEGNKRNKEARRDKEGRKEGSKETKKEKEIKKERDRERERELIIALASSSAVTVTSIPAPGKGPDAPPPPGPEKAEGKSKLSIFKKIKVKDARDDRDPTAPSQGPATAPAPAQPSRDSSPDLMIDETPGRGQRRPPEEPPPEAPPPRGDPAPEEVRPRSPADYPSYQDDLSPPTTPSTPRTPEIPTHLPPHRSLDKRRGRDKGREKRPRKDRSKSPKGGPFSPVPRDPGEPDPPERPKTPEVGLGLSMEDMGVPPGGPFLPTFPNAPGFIPPFSRFPFLPPFGGPPPRPGMTPPITIPDLRLPPHHPFLPRPPLKRPLDEDPLCSVEDNEHLDRPPTPRHPRESSPLILRGHGSPMRSPSPSTPPRPRTPAHHSPPPQALPRPHPRPEKPDKTDKEKKKEHKKEKKEKEKEKEKVKKKKDKKDKEKEKDKSDKRKEKEKMKQEKKEKKVKREKEDTSGPKITMKLCGPSTSAEGPIPTTPKLVIKPVVKHDNSPPPPPPPSTQDDQPGSPEIAKISALITRPPRSQQKRAESPQTLPVLKIKDVTNPIIKHKEAKESGHTPAKVKEVPPLKIKNPTTTSNKGSSKIASVTPKQSMAKLPTSPKATTCPKPPVPVPKVIDEKKLPGIKKPREKKEKKEKKKELPAPASNPLVGSLSKPGLTAGVTGEASYPTHSPMPLVSPPLDTPKPSKKQEQKGPGLLTETVGPIGHFVDDQGNEVWICPTCGKQDDGSPMIGCDTCDDWYHWVCVGIQVPPNDDVNWYCPRCLSQHKQRGAPPEKKKRGRKKK